MKFDFGSPEVIPLPHRRKGRRRKVSAAGEVLGFPIHRASGLIDRCSHEYLAWPTLAERQGYWQSVLQQLRSQSAAAGRPVSEAELVAFRDAVQARIDELACQRSQGGAA